MTYTVLEIGSGSYKLHREGSFSLRFQSSLGKNLHKSRLASESVKIALASMREQILPMLAEHEIKPSEVLVFATAAVREAMKDPRGSGEKFIRQLEDFGFEDIKVFSEEQECLYAAMAVYEELKDDYQDFLLLDTGGASHQLIEIAAGDIVQQKSFPIGSHADLSKIQLPNYLAHNYSQDKPLALIGTSAAILHEIPNMNRNSLVEIVENLEPMDIEARRNFLKLLIPNEASYDLLVDFRLAVINNAFRIILEIAQQLRCFDFLYSPSQSMNFVSVRGFALHEIS
ncbi:MAG: hypothetical protein OXU45_05545 [Candidatus Melainabacteria bacterium]|nr:hypothetical protein [Candidatus Melainabacteria bacterium]